MDKQTAREEAIRKYQLGGFKLCEGEVNGQIECAVHVLVPDWPVMVAAGRGPTWEQALAAAEDFQFRLHREPGWCIPEIVGRSSEMPSQMKERLLKQHQATATKFDVIFGIKRGVPYKVELGQVFSEIEDGTNHGVALAILRLQEHLLGVVTTRRGFVDRNPILIGEDELVDESIYHLELAEWRRHSVRRR